jgi:hypothetical protein
MAPKRLRGAGGQAAIAAGRRRLGLIRLNRAQPRTVARYSRAYAMLQNWMRAHGLENINNLESLDHAIGWYIESLWHEGESRSLAADTLSAVQYFCMRRHFLTGSWMLISAWQRLELPVRAPPMPALVLAALAGAALQRNDVPLAVCFLVGFHCYLRSGEMAFLQGGHFHLSSDTSGVLILPWTKSGIRRGAQEMVRLDDQCVIRWVCRAKAAVGNAQFASAIRLRQFMDSMLTFWGLTHFGLRPYSIRRGGATHDFRASNDIQRILLRGRWGNVATARIYLTEGLAELLNQALPEPMTQFLMSVALCLNQ